jgi:hypothetical protein
MTNRAARPERSNKKIKRATTGAAKQLPTIVFCLFFSWRVLKTARTPPPQGFFIR